MGEVKVGRIRHRFLRRDDGSWNAFSAKASRLAMRAYPLAA
jgi:hypothetical protein